MSTQQYNGSELVVQALKALKVKYIFGYPGGSVLDLYDALFQQDDVEHILVRHEQAATHMADGYARATGEVGVVLATSGPGATNCITGIATAYMDSIPMVVLSGQVPTNLIGDDAFQETDIVGCSRPIVKHSFNCRSAKDIPKILAKAFYIASTGRPGPVVVELPKDMLNPALKFDFEFPATTELRTYSPNTKGHPKQIRKAVAAILEAKKLVIYSGGGIIISNTSEQLTHLVESLNAPITNTLMGLGGISGVHPNFVGMLGMHGSLEANKAMANADVILALGARFDDRVTNNVKKFCPNATIVHVDVDPTSISKTIKAHIPVVGCLSTVLEQLQTAIDKSPIKIDRSAQEDWWRQIISWREQKCLSYSTAGDKIKPQAVIEAIYKATNGDAYISSDVGQHQMFAAQYYPFKNPRQWINSGGLGTMGFGLPAAMGVKLAFPDKESVCVTGDGSIQMNIQELSTCLQYNLAVKVVSLNNRSLGMVRQWQDMVYGGRHSSSYMESLPDFVKLAESYGHVGIRVNTLDELQPAIDKAMSITDRLVFLDILVDENEHVYPMQIKLGAVDEMWLRKGVKA
ncbi:acetolactate synthase 3 large subunit [Pseudoalteromonas sp. SR44-5]|jgi:acetolactate synthase-1/2/3 large subunit|uniref:Acetolactate synthase n=1 Tax=Pseudoalteromonas neustonica TaxID=1840331 RepID=A0ABY3FF35_9GAMM|nr:MULTISPECIES: acetolactate synthase 3 large subunit [Pseudoalteromonas]MBB1301668.1 acetolactate synthase 3 large subunit [Pseudoalteromonas sp. SR44-8]MBB1309793.1 acetolactate synthase 3 large subunit [Pseudoalteromonas sp. SR41-8]MBB1367494.1 acetolactate synthase 3 large subunit [Pseudoalteromonas sp. SR44-5]MBB1396422.1 acetolactate synthase 3 large subunit [Pseudoalteromonas sp. SG44-8]MBB1409787.1 acetolactate synthase 3 large subunit [Pseudoalteromonas sp. SG44-17]|tara:strand:+ start:953 stop:2677 length:1725 start_codon:yes stop_codon:yes gene_type:complete